MANRFLNNITINDEYTLPSADGTADQIITTDGAGQLSFVDQSTINAGNAEHVVIYAKNTHTASIAKGTPVYITGTVGATDTVEIAPADASNSAKMPAVGLLDDTLAVNAFGYVITGGFMDNVTTDPIDGATPSSNDTVYVKAGGGLTLTKPTGPTGLIQNIAKVGKVSGGNSGSLIVSSILRTNDVPNLTTGKIWVGDGNTTESTVVHLDETNNRLGINQTSPIGAVHILGPNTNPAMTTSALVIEQGDGAKILIDGNDIDAAAGMLYLNDYSTNDVVFGGQIRVGGGGSPVGNSWFANGNVGIGTTSPDYKLEVSGALGVSRTDGIIFAGSAGTGTGSKIASNTSNDLIFSTALASSPYTTTERVRVLNNGFVGIGTDSPNELLEIKSATIPGIRLNSTSTSFPTFGKIDAYNNTTFRGSLTWAQNPVQNGARITYIGFPSGVQTTGTFEVGSNFVDTSINNGSMVTRLNTTGLGIGTTSPNRLLTVQTTSTGSYIAMNASTGNTTIGSDVNGGFIVYDDTNSSYRMVINRSTGNVGIGTTSPSQKLDVVGSAQITNDIYLGRYIFHDGDTNTWLGFPLADTISFRTNGSDRMYINSSGNVGIGTTSPAEKLDVSGNVQFDNGDFNVLNSTGSYGGRSIARFRNGADQIQFGDVEGYISGNTFDINYGSSICNFVKMNVGIDNASPSYLLDVSGDGRVNGTFRCVSLIQTSQRDQKTEIELVGKETTSLPIKRYKYKSGDNNKLRYGVVAEDIESSYPELVETDAEGIKGVKYIDFLVRKIAELETEKRTLVNWRHYHSNTSYNMLYDTGMTTAFPYAYGSIPAPYDMYFTSFTLINNPYSSYNKGPEGDTAIVQAYVNNTLVHEIRDIRYGNNPFESITVDFGQNVALRQGQALQIRFQANGAWRYCNSTIILTEK